MQIPTRYSYPRHLDRALWENGISARRSAEITPLYVERYLGVRKGEVWGAHSHWEFTCVLSGQGKLIGRQNIDLFPYSICLVPPGWEYTEKSEEAMDTIWVGFSGSRIPSLHMDNPRIMHNPDLAVVFEEMWLLAENRQLPIGLELEGLTTTILGRFLRLSQGGDSHAEDSPVQAAIRFLDAHFDHAISVSDLAKRFGCSPGYFHRAFKRATGQTPAGYLTQIRMEHAIHWLEASDLPIGRIARLTGYEDAFYFSRVVKKSTGLSPSQIRERKKAL